MTLGEFAEHDIAPDPGNWTLTQDALEIQFKSYALGAGRLFQPHVAAPWTALRSVMVADPPLP